MVALAARSLVIFSPPMVAMVEARVRRQMAAATDWDLPIRLRRQLSEESGGFGSGMGYHGGNGASLTNAATASFLGDVGSVSVSQSGGSGGVGLYGAAAGNGGDSSLTNCISGGATTRFTLSQTAIGGNSGPTLSNVGGATTGNASSALTFTNSLGGDVYGTSTAVGGSGGHNRD